MIFFQKKAFFCGIFHPTEWNWCWIEVVHRPTARRLAHTSSSTQKTKIPCE